MCGIVGFWDVARRLSGDETVAALRRMTDSLRHRGPDDDGCYQDQEAGLSVGFRRLSIVDLSAEGHQPMISASGRYVIVFNGEVYNHVRLRPELEQAGFTFRGHSDTEVMLAAVEHWGLEAALQHFIGMFAFALWDREERTLTLVRDRLGVKPLYFGWVGSLFAFASELGAIHSLPWFANPIDRDALSLYLRYNYIPAPRSIYRGLYKMMPGTLLQVDQQLATRSLEAPAVAARAHSFWTAREVAEMGASDPLELSDTQAVADLDRILRDAVALRMQADVPLGAFLSGGIDSSTVVALMQAQSSRPVKTFSIGFRETGFNEATYAKAVAIHLGTEHHELYLTGQDALDVVPRLPSMFDEPFSDSSQIPTYLVSTLARQHVTVSLSGDGGDELFGGYNRYFWALRLRSTLQLVPSPIRRAVSRLLRSRPRSCGFVLEYSNRLIPARLRLANPASKVGALADMLAAMNDEERYLLLVSHWRQPEAIVVHGREPMTAVTDPALRPALANSVERMMYTDLVTYLPDDILTKLDRASMAVSLEARVPLLDHRVVEFAWRVPLHQKVRNGQGKWLLRQVLSRYVPYKLTDRPKMGFGVPISEWLRGPLRNWAEPLLDERRLREDGYFDPAPIRALWRAHLVGRVNEPYRLWDVLMFQAWLEQTRGLSSVADSDLGRTSIHAVGKFPLDYGNAASREL